MALSGMCREREREREREMCRESEREREAPAALIFAIARGICRFLCTHTHTHTHNTHTHIHIHTHTGDMCTITHGEGAVCEAEGSDYDTRHVVERVFVTAPLHSRVSLPLTLTLSLTP